MGLSVLLDSHTATELCVSEWMRPQPFMARFWISIQVVYLQRYLVVKWLVAREDAAVSAHVPCTPCNHAPVYAVTSCKATYVECIIMCLIVTCQPHLWENDRDILRATAVTWGCMLHPIAVLWATSCSSTVSYILFQYCRLDPFVIM